MKKIILLVFLFCLFSTTSYAQSSGPGGGGDVDVDVDSVFGRTGVVTPQSGDYDTDEITEVTNKKFVTDADITLLGNTSGENSGDNATNSQYSGLEASKLDTENHLGITNINNILLYSGDFSNASWVTTDTTITKYTGYQNISKGVTGSAKRVNISQMGAIGIAGKFYTVIVKCRAKTEDAQELTITVTSWGTGGFTGTYYLEKDVWSIITLSSLEAENDGTLAFGIQSDSTTEARSYDIEYIIMRETMPPTVLIVGDSIDEAAYEDKGGEYYTLKQDVYAYLFATGNNLELNQLAAPTTTLTEIQTAFFAELDANPKQPIIFIGGGTNDTNDSGDDNSTEMLAVQSATIVRAKAASSNIILRDIPISPMILTDVSRTAWARAYNTKLKAAHGTDSSITFLETNTVLTVPGDYDTKAFGTHPNIVGQGKLLTLLETLFVAPRNLATYEYVETYDDPWYSHADVLNVILDNNIGMNTGDVTVTDTDEIDMTVTGQDIKADIIAGSIDETKLDTSVNASLDLADSALQSITSMDIDLPENEILIGNGSGKADNASTEELTGDWKTTGSLSGQAKVTTDTSGAITIAVNAVNYGTDTGDADIPATACDAAADVGNWVVLISANKDQYSLTSDDASNIFILADNSTLTAGDELDVDGSMVFVMCIAADYWKVIGYIDVAPTDGGVAD